MFAFQSCDRSSHEIQTVALYCNYHKIERRFFSRWQDVPKGWIPVGCVKWCQQVLGHNEVPDYYPDFLESWLHRKIWKADKWPVGTKCFIKPADTHKRFTGFVTSGTYKGKKKGPYWCSEIVKFVTEWRYYVGNGQVIAAKYCCGEETEAPQLDINWPENFCGACDFGILDNGKLALVECNGAFACGWYGNMMEGEQYVKWLQCGWKNLTQNNP